jgi:hypothetical protein
MSLERARVRIEALQRAVLDGVQEFEGEPDRIRVDLGLITVFADERPLQGLAGLMDWRRSGRISGLIRSGFCTGSAGERVLMPGNAGLPVERVVLVGLGPRSEFDKEAAQRVAGDLLATATGLGAERVLVALPSHAERRPAELLFAALTEALERAEPPSPPREPPSAGPTDPPSELEPDPAEPAPAGAPEPPLHWWVVADERVVARLRRVLSGPPRATSGGLHT